MINEKIADASQLMWHLNRVEESARDAVRVLDVTSDEYLRLKISLGQLDDFVASAQGEQGQNND
jgi:hypothetical protein